MLFDAPAIMRTMGRVKVLREIKVTVENYEAVARALGLDPKKKGVKPASIYIVQDEPIVDERK